MSGSLPKIYAFVNGGQSGWYDVVGLAEDGDHLASHICSHPGFGPHDLGVTSDWKHDIYQKKYPGGFEVVWVEGDPTQHPGAAEAIRLNEARAAAPTAKEGGNG